MKAHRYSLYLLLSYCYYSDKAEWILDTRATYHVCPNRARFSSFEKLDGCYTVMGDNHPCNIEGLGTVCIKMDDGIARELKEVRYVPQLKRKLISVVLAQRPFTLVLMMINSCSYSLLIIL